MNELVEIHILEQRPDGTIGIGCSVEVSRAEAEKLVAAGEAKFPGVPMGSAVVAVKVEEEEEDGADHN